MLPSKMLRGSPYSASPTGAGRIAARMIVLWLIVAGCSSTHPNRAIAPTTTTSTSSTTVATVPSSTATTKATTASTVSAGARLPAGFAATDLTWVSDTQGWALGNAPCTHPPCTSVAHTLDGGQTWDGLPAPRAYLQAEFPNNPVPPACSATTACVNGIRFADASTGYAFGVSSLWLTTNGGRTWTLRSNDVTDALEIIHGLVIRVTHPGDVGCPPGCPYRVQATSIGSTTWQSLPSPDLTGTGVALAVEGPNFYVGSFGHTAGGAQDAHTKFARSSDNGGHWSTMADPCGTASSGSEADATAMSAAPGGYLAVACTVRASNEAGFVVVSADGGATFGPQRGGLLSSPAQGQSLQRIAAATGQRLAVLEYSIAGFAITVTNDAGADWTTTHAESAPSNGSFDLYLGFQDTTTARAILNPRVILTTNDGGGHWTPFTFP